MSGGLFAVNVPLHHTVLENTDGRQNIESVFVARVNTVKDQADHNLLPSWTSLVPELGLLQVDNFSNVLHDTVESTRSQHLVFIVVGNSNQELGMAIVHRWAEIIAVLKGEIIGIASCGSICITC